jgi:hypothetical protein
VFDVLTEEMSQVRSQSVQPTSASPAAIVVMHMKRSSIPVICLQKMTNALKDLQARGVIASNPEPLLADWNEYPLQPTQTANVVMAVHRRNADDSLGELITQVSI